MHRLTGINQSAYSAFPMPNVDCLFPDADAIRTSRSVSTIGRNALIGFPRSSDNTALSGVTKYTYQSGIFGQGRLLNTLTDAKSQSTTFGYDTRGRVTSVTNPLGQSRYYEEKRKGDAFYYLTIVDKHSISKNRP